MQPKSKTPAAELKLDNPELVMLTNNKEEGYNYRQRRQEDWRENYMYFRDRVIINRLTQRQSVNLPIIKMVVGTAMKDIDDMPAIFFENLDNDKQAEVFKNEYWKYTDEQNKMELQDIVDKKQGILFGRTFDQWQIADGKIKQTIIDPQDILLSRYTDPSNIHSSRYLIHLHIFKPLSTLVGNPLYDQEAVKRLQTYYANEQGIVKASDNAKMLVEKNKKMQDMGVPDVDSPILGETYVELSMHFVYRNNEKDAEGNVLPEQIFLYVEAENMEILQKASLESLIGETKDHYFRNHFPYVSWASDLEKQDVWNDSIADIARNPNKVANAWWSQKVENRTLQNAGLKYYDATIEGFVPPSNMPIVAGGWYPLPGKPADVFTHVPIPELTGTIDDLNFLLTIVEKATGATSTSQGVTDQKQITLGEVKLALTEAKQRIKGLSKFYTQAWKDRGEMFYKLLEAAPDQIDAVTIYKKGRNTSDIYSREISPKDWQAAAGYRCRVWSKDEKDQNDENTLQKQNAVMTAMPGNAKVIEVYQRTLLEWAGYTPDQVNEAMQLEEEKRNALMAQLAQQALTGGGQIDPNTGQPIQPAGGGPNPNQPQPQLQLQAPVANQQPAGA